MIHVWTNKTQKEWHRSTTMGGRISRGKDSYEVEQATEAGADDGGGFTAGEVAGSGLGASGQG